MEINYDFYKSPKRRDQATEDDNYHIRLVEHQTVALKQLSQIIKNRCTVSEADIMGTLSALSEVLCEQLLSGNRVRIDGLGYFSLSVKGDVTRDSKGQLQLRKARVEGVNFKADKAVLKSVSQVKLTRENHVGNHSVDITDEEIVKRIEKFSAEKGLMRVMDFRQITGLTPATASRRLAKLVADGALENVNTGHLPLYQLKK